jgi:hypothetical protein
LNTRDEKNRKKKKNKKKTRGIKRRRKKSINFFCEGTNELLHITRRFCFSSSLQDIEKMKNFLKTLGEKRKEKKRKKKGRPDYHRGKCGTTTPRQLHVIEKGRERGCGISTPIRSP